MNYNNKNESVFNSEKITGRQSELHNKNESVLNSGKDTQIRLKTDSKSEIWNCQEHFGNKHKKLQLA